MSWRKTVAVIAVCLLGLPAAEAADYLITDYGAVADTAVLSTEAIQRAIDECSDAGGGRVVIPAGMYKTGSIRLRSRVHIHLESGATLFGSTDLADYRKEKPDYVSLRTQTSTVQLIYADGEEDVVIDGYGTIDGQGRVFPKLQETDEGITRPHLMRFICCKGVTVSGVTLRNSGCWMQHYLACDDVRISGVRVFNRNNYNNDALDLDGCHNVVVSDLIADSDDDGITLKSTSPRCCENVAISNCVVSSRCNAIKLGTETNGGFRNISITGCVVKPSQVQTPKYFGFDHGISAISLEIVDGGVMENVSVSGIVVEGTESPIFIRLGNRARPYCEGQVIDKVGTIDGVRISDVVVRGCGSVGCSVTGLPGHPVRNVALRGITILQKGGCGEVPVPEDEKETSYPESTMWGDLPASGFFVRHAENVTLEDVSVRCIESDSRPLFVFEDVVCGER